MTAAVGLALHIASGAGCHWRLDTGWILQPGEYRIETIHIPAAKKTRATTRPSGRVTAKKINQTDITMLLTG